MYRWFCAFLISLLLLVYPAYCQSPGIRGPVGGFVYSPSDHTLRPLRGVPGATYIAPAVLNGLDFASVSPAGDWALVSRSGLYTFEHGFSAGDPTESSVDGLIQAIDNVVWSRDGSFALLYSSSENQLQRVRLSATDITLDDPLDLSAWGTASTFAIDPAGHQIAFGIAGSGEYLLKVGQSPALLLNTTHPGPAAFDETGARLFMVDLDQQQVVVFDSGAGPIPFASLAREGSPLSPVGLAISSGGRYLSLADKTTRSVQVYETASQTLVNTIPLDFTPSRFEALSNGPTFLLNGDNRQDWLLVLDARQVPSVYFVPAAQEQL